MVLAILTSTCAAAIMWSRYCPSLRDTGVVSSATGFLDFLSYMAAAVSNTVMQNIPPQHKDAIRAVILKQMLMTQI